MKITTDFSGDFTTLQNDIFRDNRISYKAIGLYCQMLSVLHNSNWNYSEKGFASLHTDGLARVRSGLKELEKFGWVSRKKFKDNKGFFDMEYILHHIIIELKSNPICENPIQDNRTYNKELKDKKIKEKWEQEKIFLEDFKKSNFVSYTSQIFKLQKEWRKTDSEIKKELIKFAGYWLEPQVNKKPRIDKEVAFDINRRINTWFASPWCFGKKPDPIKIAEQKRNEESGVESFGDLLKRMVIKN